MLYPEEGVYRGLASADSCYGSSAEISPAAFQFRPNLARDDNLEECSVNWIDDDGALVNIAAQTSNKNGVSSEQFKFGACRICLDNLSDLKDRFPGIFSFERCPVLEQHDDNGPNPYHGNLLLNLSTTKEPKGLRRHISSILAFVSEKAATRVELDSLINAL